MTNLKVRATERTLQSGRYVPPGFYVYALVDPIDLKPFYIGKGKGRRYAQHMAEHRLGQRVNPRKHARIATILARGETVQYRIMADGLTEGAALELERDIIRTNGTGLTNLMGPPLSPRETAILALANMIPYRRWLRMRHRNAQARYVYRLVEYGYRLIIAGGPRHAKG